jgi:hypothetical protein
MGAKDAAYLPLYESSENKDCDIIVPVALADISTAVERLD